MRHEDFDLETATPVKTSLFDFDALPFLASKPKSKKAKDVKMPANLMGDDFFCGF